MSSTMSSQSPQFVLCPYCGHAQEASDRCGECGGLFEPLSIKATQISMGPWYIRDRNRPFHPGCSFEILRRQIDAGRIKPTTILRGPTTHQLWDIARNVPGVAHLIGYCHKCNTKVSRDERKCPKCEAPFRTPNQRDELGLFYKSEMEAAKARTELRTQIERATGQAPAPSKSEPSAPKQEHQPRKKQTAPQQEVVHHKPQRDEPVVAATHASEHLTPPRPEAPPIRPGEDLLAEIIGSAPSSVAAPEVTSSSTSSYSTQAIDLEKVNATGQSERAEFYDSTADEPDSQPTGALPTQRTSPVTIVLVTVNVLVLLLVGYWMLRNNTTQQPSAAPPVAPRTAPGNATNSPSPAPPQSYSAPTGSAGSRQAPPVSSHSGNTPETAAQPSSNDTPSEDNITQALRAAEALETAGKLDEALGKLRQLARDTPLSQRPAGLDERIRRLEGRIAQRNSTPMFDTRGN
jgi:hypothetical protein